MEVIVTMAISAILIGITYTSYRIISGSYTSFHARNEKFSTVEKLDELFKKDSNKAELIERSDSGLLFREKETSIRYQFTPDAIIRISSERDTFRVKNQGPAYSFEGQPATEPGGTGNTRTDEISISIQLENEPILLRYHKLYSSVNLFNPNTDALN